MKNLFLICLLGLSIQTNAQIEKKILKQIIGGEYTLLGSQLDDRIDICILDNQDFVTKQQAVADVKTFLDGTKITSWDIIHNGNSKGNTSRYAVAELNTSETKYRMMFYFSGNGDKESITELRIEK